MAANESTTKSTASVSASPDKKRRSEATGVRGVTKFLDRSENCYYAYITVAYKTYSLGCYQTIEEAAAIRQRAMSEKVHGTFFSWYKRFARRRKERVELCRYNAKLPTKDADGTPIPPVGKRVIGGISMRRSRYVVQVEFSGKTVSIGTMPTYREALQLRLEAEEHLDCDFSEWLREKRAFLKSSALSVQS